MPLFKTLFWILISYAFGAIAQDQSTQEDSSYDERIDYDEHFEYQQELPPCTKLCDLEFMETVTAEELQKLIDEGHDVNGYDDESTGLRPLFVTDRIDIKEVLIKNGADVNQRDSFNSTPLHMFSSFKGLSLKVVEFLIKNGADIHAKDKLGETSLVKASMWLQSKPVKKERSKVFGLLLYHGAFLEDQDRHGKAIIDRFLSCEDDLEASPFC